MSIAYWMFIHVEQLFVTELIMIYLTDVISS